jgi:hypothetical protein
LIFKFLRKIEQLIRVGSIFRIINTSLFFAEKALNFGFGGFFEVRGIGPASCRCQSLPLWHQGKSYGASFPHFGKVDIDFFGLVAFVLIIGFS